MIKWIELPNKKSLSIPSESEKENTRKGVLFGAGEGKEASASSGRRSAGDFLWERENLSGAQRRPNSNRGSRAKAKKKTPERVFCLERVKGIGPSQPAWKAGALPLSYTRNSMVEESGFEPLKAKLTDLQSVPFGRLGNSSILELVRVIEPPTYWLQINCSAYWATPAN